MAPRRSLPPEPAHLHALERMPAPFEALPNPLSNHPGEVRTDWRKMRTLAPRRRCSVCGCALRTAWRPFATDDAGDDGVYVSGGVAPMHRSCALFSALTCPWLSTATSRGRRFHRLRGAMTIRGFAQWGDACPIRDPSLEALEYVYFDEIEAIDCGASWHDIDVDSADLHEDVDVSTRLDMARCNEYWRCDTKDLREHVHTCEVCRSAAAQTAQAAQRVLSATPVWWRPAVLHAARHQQARHT
jgi:hypothetical protein